MQSLYNVQNLWAGIFPSTIFLSFEPNAAKSALYHKHEYIKHEHEEKHVNNIKMLQVLFCNIYS